MKKHFCSGRGAAAVAAVTTLGGCTALLGLDQDYRLRDGGGTSGTGGTTSSSGAGEATSSSGTGGESGTGAVGKLGETCKDVQQLACAGNAQKLQLICGPEHVWKANGTCGESTFCDTAMGADQGTCKPVATECAAASPGEVFCAGMTRIQCGPDLVTTDAVETCAYLCSAGACVPPSCADLPPTCGASGNESCCASSVVAGGSYSRSNDSTSPATVSDFRLDKFEITVGRFRQFVAGYPGNKPAAGAGEHPLITGSGWQTEWDASLALDQAALKVAVKCDSMQQTWTDMPGSNENKPINCINWHEAFAFCAWDGGRLVTEAEWNYAAAGGNEQRAYPWSNPPNSTTINSSYAVYNGAELDGVGSKSPKGDGKWGQADMGGGVWEWNMDWYGDPYVKECSDCAVVSQGVASERVIRGGSWDYDALYLLSSVRLFGTPAYHFSFTGARCARKP